MDFEKLRSRLKESTDDEIYAVLTVLHRYNLNINIRNFDKYGIVLRDQRGKSVRVLDANKKRYTIYCRDPKAEIVIFSLEGILAGWIESDKLIKADAEYSVPLKSLHSMPPSFLFVQECPHLSIYGGIMEEDYWECLGCGERLVSSGAE